MEFKPLKLERLIHITEIITIHYFEYDSAFIFPGETHPFWELLCVDKGLVEVTAGQNTFHLSTHDIVFHQPEEFHALKAGVPAPNLIVITFSSDSASMDFFRKKRLKIDSLEKNLLASIISEAKASFADPLDNPSQREIRLKDGASPASRQMIALYLENFLLHLMRRCGQSAFPTPALSPAREKSETQLPEQIRSYLLSHLAQHLTREEIARAHLISVSQLEKVIRSHFHCGINQYFISLKIAQAKQLIRNRDMNFSQISAALGYSSVHYFSRQFKKVTGMSPSEYAASVKSSVGM